MKINVLEKVDGVLQPITRDMTPEEAAEYQRILAESAVTEYEQILEEQAKNIEE